jgi:hypothetical protein
MNRYSTGKIYKLVNDVDNRIYIGSTCMPLAKRKSTHKALARKRPNQNVYSALNAVGWDNVRIILIENVFCNSKEELLSREQYYIDLLRPSLNSQAAVYNDCPHGRERHKCIPCGGAGICEHGRIRSTCIPCGGVSICEHGRIRSQCIPCGGSKICEHVRIRHHCIPCGGAGICEHGRIRHQCIPCGGTSICEHGLNKKYCKECSPVKCDFCEIILSKGTYKRHIQSKNHIYNFIHY